MAVVAAAVEEAGPVAVAAVIVAETAEVGYQPCWLSRRRGPVRGCFTERGYRASLQLYPFCSDMRE